MALGTRYTQGPADAPTCFPVPALFPCPGVAVVYTCVVGRGVAVWNVRHP